MEKKRVLVRFSEKQYDALQRGMKERGITNQSQYIRNALNSYSNSNANNADTGFDDHSLQTVMNIVRCLSIDKSTKAMIGREVDRIARINNQSK